MIKIDGQPSLFLLDLKGKEYPAIAEVNRKKRVNGQREISLSFLYDQINQDFLHDIEFGWKVLFKSEWYTITGPTYSLDGDVFSVGVDAVLSFFVDMNGHYLQDEVEDKSQTPAAYFRDLFQDTGYSYVLADNLLANTLNYQANQSKTERFLYGIDRFKGEYVIRGKVAYVHGLIGSDKDVILHEDLNIQDVSIEVDASGFHTWAKGFGDKDEGSEDADYELEVEYVSPLVEKHGYIEGPAIRDGSYKHKDALTEAVKNQVENSYKISTTITAVDLTKNGYPEMQFEEGDRVWLFVTQLNQNQQVRVVEIDETFDWEGNIVAVQYVLGNEGIAARYKTQQYNTISDFRDIQSGRKTLEFNWLPEAIRRASDIINGNIDSHFSYRAGEVIGINRSNPNGYMRFNTDGIGFSRDGGKTYNSAMTYEGIVADAITAGTLRGIVIEGVDIFGGYIQSLNNDNTFWDLGTGLFRMQNTQFVLGGGARIDFTSRGNRITYRYTSDITRSAGMGVGVALGDEHPFTYLGATGASELDTLSRYYSGFIANTTARIAEGGSNSINGYRLEFRNEAVGWTKGITFDWNGSSPTIETIGPSSYDYTLGTFKTLLGKAGFSVRNYYNSDKGWSMETDLSGGYMTFRGINGGIYNYNLGSSESYNHFSFGYIDYLRGSSDTSGVGSNDNPYRYGHIRSLTVHDNFYNNSLREYKENIEDLPINVALDFVRNNDIKTFNYIGNPVKSIGLIRDELNIEDESLIANETAIETINVQFMNQKVLQYVLEKTESQEKMIQAQEKRITELGG